MLSVTSDFVMVTLVIIIDIVRLIVRKIISVVPEIRIVVVWFVFVFRSNRRARRTCSHAGFKFVTVATATTSSIAITITWSCICGCPATTGRFRHCNTGFTKDLQVFSHSSTTTTTCIPLVVFAGDVLGDIHGSFFDGIE